MVKKSEYRKSATLAKKANATKITPDTKTNIARLNIFKRNFRQM